MSETNDFILNALKQERGEPVTTEDTVVEDVVETVEEVVEPIKSTDEPIVAVDPVVETPAQPITEKVKIDYSQWLEQNEGSISEYLNEKKRDYKSLSDAEAIRLKVKQDNPVFDEGDVEAELRDKYGVGLEKVVIDEDEMSAEEIKEAKKHNSFIEKGQRLLKQEAFKAREDFEQRKGTLTLPELEYELTKQNPDISQEELQKQLVDQVKEYKETKWIPSLKEAVVSVESLKHSIEVEDDGGKVALEIDYKLGEKEKAKLVEHLSDYVSQTTDNKYIKEDGTADLQSFLTDKGKELFFNEMLKSGIKEAIAKTKKQVIKNELLNHDDGIVNRVNADDLSNLSVDQLKQKALGWG